MAMKIQTKIFLLLILFIVMFMLGLIFLRFSEAGRKELIFQDRERERNEFFDKIVELKRLPLEDFARTYTYWDEMVHFVATGDKKWGYENLYTSLEEYGAHATWIYRTDFYLVYSANILGDKSLREIPLPEEAYKELFKQSRFCHFFVSTDKGVMEIHGATIHPTSDYARRTPPKGYFFNGRLLDKKYIDELSKLTSGTITISPHSDEEEISKSGNNSEKGVITFIRTLSSWDGSPLARIHVRSESPIMKEITRSSNQQLILSIIFALALL
ncbi:MAG TPA: CHASE4 domain-containing protein, partial [Thermodesulfobacteriota bacterium]|nr:CHASE4 domain-containing protein [Thermodesulfobacteriota bacterium]